MNIQPLTANSYTLLLIQSKVEGVHICKNDETSEQKAFKIKKGFVPQSLRDVILDGYTVLNDLKNNPKDARTVIDILKMKCEKKEAKNQLDSAFMKVIKLICDYVRNLFTGYGLHSTLGLADNLISELESVAVASEDSSQPKPLKIDQLNQPSMNPNQGISLQALTEKKIKEALDSYSKNPLNCPDEFKEIIFNNVVRIFPDPTSSLEDLIKNTAELEPKINLSTPICSQVVLDMFNVGNSDGRDKALAEWLSHQSTLDRGLLNKCIEHFKNKPKNNDALKRLLQISIERNWDDDGTASQLIGTPSEPTTPIKTPRASPSSPKNEEPIAVPTTPKKSPKVTERYQPKQGELKKEPPKLEGLISNKISFNLKNTLTEYRKNPSECDPKIKFSLFRNIKKISSINPCSTMEGLIGHLQGLSDCIDLADPKCAQVVLDTVEFCGTGDLPDDLAEWLYQNKTFNSKLLIDCLKVIIRKNKDISISLLKKLLLMYRGKKDWNDETLSTAIALLFMRNPNFEENNLENLIKQIINDESLSFITFLKWVAVFKYKEDDFIAEEGKNLSFHYPIVNDLIQRSAKENWSLQIDFNNKEQINALEFVLGYYKGHEKLGAMTPENLLKEMLHYIEMKEKALV